ncbi:MAG: hypothetical protein K2R98_28390 [Gemmataceae bacterium]|nr:hypothetical protein [Gemmataceae bacterium]
MPDDRQESPDDLLDYHDIGKVFGLHYKTIARWDRAGLMPRPSFVVRSYRRWKRSRIQAWIDLGGVADAMDKSEQFGIGEGGEGGQEPSERPRRRKIRNKSEHDEERTGNA